MLFQNLTDLKKHFFQSLAKHYSSREITIFFQWGTHFFHQLNPIESVLEAAQTPLNTAQIEAWYSLETALLQRQPIQYFFEQAYFFDLTLKVTPDVLIPRPETESLVILALEIIQNHQYTNLLDIGTGSGCIPIAIGHKTKQKININACDISQKALNISKQNSDKYKINVNFFQCNILEEKLPEKYDLIISNPPYIPFSDQKKMDTNVLHYEPHQALFVPNEDPLLFYRRILELSEYHLNPSGTLIFEIHENFAEELLFLLEKNNKKGTIKKDLQGKNRFLIC